MKVLDDPLQNCNELHCKTSFRLLCSLHIFWPKNNTSLVEKVNGLIQFVSTEQVPFRKEFVDEMKFILKCESDVKVIRRPKSQSMELQDSAASLHSNKSHHTMLTGSGTDRGDRSNVVPRYKE